MPLEPQLPINSTAAGPDADDPLAPCIGLATGLLASFVVWAFLGACMLAAYQLAPPWVVTTVQGVLLAGGAR